MILVALFYVVIFWGVAIWAVVDAASRSSRSFAAAGSSKVLWITLIVFFSLFLGPIGFIIALIYLIAIRPKVSRYA